ncbi:hypothetical protein F8388_005791 [Cannabis sativa]|uniref:Peptidase metallopeptidase domain-containing protein n=1 Tax=Cannabis sativa TaxID=3483 RepID=A0A7J6HNP3_CANSA|nr:hypothetical protein F8388_005791 [Cannabis sativa]
MNHSLSISAILYFLIISPKCLPATVISEYKTLEDRHSKLDPSVKTSSAASPIIENYQVSFLNSNRESDIIGLSKNYLHRFGYLRPQQKVTFNNELDDELESAIIQFQSSHGLSVTGKLDFETIAQIKTPRCGVADVISTLHGSKRYQYFPGRPRWTRRMHMTLTYAFSPDYMIRYLSFSDIRAVFKRAFSRWSSVIPVGFSETEDYVYADIKIGFYSGDHGDSEPFDGILGVLAHSFSPESGKFHLDAAERWAVDFGSEESTIAIDLESVATHEIGHLLGLTHTPIKEAVMYPSLKPRERKTDLQLDDIQGVQALYGSNPNFTMNSLLESDIATNHAFHYPITTTKFFNIFVLMLLLKLLLNFIRSSAQAASPFLAISLSALSVSGFQVRSSLFERSLATTPFGVRASPSPSAPSAPPPSQRFSFAQDRDIGTISTLLTVVDWTEIDHLFSKSVFIEAIDCYARAIDEKVLSDSI